MTRIYSRSIQPNTSVTSGEPSYEKSDLVFYCPQRKLAPTHMTN
ncbi:MULTISPECIES: hypothetical protein [Reichenbachiella]|nr:MULTISPECIES: hypothetical protein [Reichenbachiella]